MARKWRIRVQQQMSYRRLCRQRKITITASTNWVTNHGQRCRTNTDWRMYVNNRTSRASWLSLDDKPMYLSGSSRGLRSAPIWSIHEGRRQLHDMSATAADGPADRSQPLWQLAYYTLHACWRLSTALDADLYRRTCIIMSYLVICTLKYWKADEF